MLPRLSAEAACAFVAKWQPALPAGVPSLYCNHKQEKMKTVLVTGATRGIGLETVKQLLDKEFFVYLGSRNLQSGQEKENEFKSQGLTNVKAIAIDVTNPDSILAAKAIIQAEKGKLDILINNAGILGGWPQPSEQTNIAIIREVFETNFFGTINVTQAFLELLKLSDAPRITNISSGLASITRLNDPSWEFYEFKTAAYGPSKTALNAYTSALAFELRDTPFKVNAVDPGHTATDFNGHNGKSSVVDSAAFVVKHSIAGDATGTYFSHDVTDGTEVSPW
jgi:NAD(P)-dependent dehydrogenase (short-subunit alcohol dehydrogenase family)